MLLGAIEAGGTKFVCATGAENGQVSDRISIPTTTPAETMTAVDDYFTTHPVDAIGIGSYHSSRKNSRSLNCIGTATILNYSHVARKLKPSIPLTSKLIDPIN